ncbi:hypothetical protein CASFOL_013510 [Castilleja foliolosa]|uniref:RNase H type-1 domain-containing protein n=1 Tax=Castilleja foliolosa TaxID=1961234 RepID=A0ABD3DK80_9LAMI
MWKIMTQAVPVDAKVATKGVFGPFRCCCKQGGFETMEHLFLDGDIAIQIWDHFGKLFRKSRLVRLTNSMILHFKLWMHSVNLNSQLGMLSLGVYAYICWEIWKARCSCKFDNQAMSSPAIISKITKQIPQLNMIISPKIHASKWDKIILAELQIRNNFDNIRKKLKQTWIKPEQGRLKLNIAGNSDTNMGGGIVRSHSGDVLFAYCMAFEAEKSKQEIILRSILEGWKICSSIGLTGIGVESDDAQVISAILEEGASAQLVYLGRQVKFSQIQKICKSQNEAANFLVKNRYNYLKIFSGNVELPQSVQIQITREKIPIPNFRSGGLNIDPG